MGERFPEIPQEIRRQVFQDMVQCIQGDHVLLLAGQGVHAGDARVFVQQVPGMGNQRKRKIRRFQPLLGAVEQRCPQFGFQVPDHFADALTVQQILAGRQKAGPPSFACFLFRSNRENIAAVSGS